MSTFSALGQAGLIGREAELATLASMLDAACRKQGQAVICRAPAGTGKSRLLHELFRMAEARGFRTFRGRAFHLEMDFPYAIVANTFQPSLRTDTGLAARLAAELPELTALFPVSALHRQAAAPTGTKAMLMEAFVRFLQLLGDEAPLLIALDDLHWADPATLELLHYTAHSVAGLSVLVAMACRSEEETENGALVRMVESLMGSGHLHTMALRALSPSEVAAMTQQMLTMDTPPSDEFVQLLYRETGGNPFFLEETIKSMIHARVLYRQDGQWRRRPITTLGVPQSVRDVILARVNRLDREERRILDLMAVYGSRTLFSSLRAITADDDLTLLDLLDRLRRAMLVREETTSAGPVYEFSHPKIQETVYTELSAARRQVMHGMIAARLEAHYGAAADPHADELALHFGLAGQPEHLLRSITYDMKAGDRAADLFAHERAASLYLRAVLHDEKAGGILTPQARFDLLDKAGLTYEWLGHPMAAAELWDQALEVTEASPGPERLAALYHRLTRVHMHQGERSRALAYCDEGLSLLEGRDRESLQAALLLHQKAETLMRSGRGQEAREVALQLLDLGRRTGSKLALGQAKVTLATLELWMGDPLGGAELIPDGIGYLEQVPGAYDERAMAVSHAAWILWEAGRRDEARAAAQRSVDLALRYGQSTAHDLALLQLGLMDWEAGEWESALAHARASLALSREQKRWRAETALALQGLILAAQGDVRGSREAADQAAELAEQGNPYLAFNPVYTYGALARTMMILGDIESALRFWERQREQLQRLGFTGRLAIPAVGPVFHAEALAQAGRTEEAAKLLEQVERACANLPDSSVHAAAAHVRGLLARAGRRTEGPRVRHPDGLSAREVEIIREVARHKSDKEIAASLFISVRTVTTHLTHIYTKLNMHSRTQLVEYALQHGLDRE